MTKFYLTAVFALVTILGQSQIVTIPDATFKNALTNQFCVDADNDGTVDADADLNNDGQIQVSEALAVTNLTLCDYYNGTTVVPVNNLTGLEAFTNVTALRINSLSAPTVDLTVLIHLQTLLVDHNFGTLATIMVGSLSSLTSITCTDNPNLTAMNLSGLSNLVHLENQLSGFDGNLTGLTSLQYLNCANNYITSLNLSHTPNLVTLICAQNNLTNLDLSGLIHLKEVDASINQITSINTNGLSQIEKLSCSSNNLTTLDIGGLITLKELACDENHIATLNIAPLIQLTVLSCSNNLLQVLPVTSLTHLKSLYCFDNQISTLDIANLTDLENLYVSSNTISSLPLSNLTHLIHLDCSFNPINNTLDAANLANLENLAAVSCGLTALNLANNDHLGNITISGNQLSSIDVSGCYNLWWLSCGGNLFSTLDLTANPILYNLDFTNSPNLTYINLKNGNTTSGGPQLIPYGCPNLFYICADENQIQNMMNSLLNFGISNVQINSYCTFTPGGTYNTITGTQTFDLDGNGCSVSDFHVPLLKIKIDDGTLTGATFTNANGNYSFYTQSGNFVLTPNFENPYFLVSPASATINFASLDGTTQTQNFCITPVGIHYDVEVTLIPLLPARPGFDVPYRLVYKNTGNQILSGNIDLDFNDAVLDFVFADPNNSNQSVNHLNWDYVNLYPFESREIYIVFNVNSPQETPAVNIGDNLHYVATLSISGGPEGNTFELDQTVTGSFDPNDKTCLEGNAITPEMVGGYLHYLIRFQNSGTAAAENIVVNDIIDTTKFDIASLQLTSTSHPQVTKIFGNKVEFQFQNINLPTEIDDEPGSHGYVAFKIKTKNNLVIGNTVTNKADIYFDYNFPITTNTATTTVALLANNTFEDKTVSVFPNPVKDQLTISAKDKITSVQLYDILGRLIETFVANDANVRLNLGKNSNGTYFVKIYTVDGVKVEKIIKE